jgi:lysozyme family protein
METETESSFKRAFKHIIEGFEGKYSNDPDDPGGETYKGISRKMNENFEGWKIIDNYKGGKNYPNILEEDINLAGMVEGFYKKNYWDEFQGDDLGEGTGEEMFDQCVRANGKEKYL